MKDRFGREFQVGQRVVYATRNSCTAQLKDGVITKVTPTTRKHWNLQTRQQEEHEWCTLQVLGRSESYDGNVKETYRTIHEVDRVVVVP